mmetsp:Transcript_10364/g.19626  ORF Transcript_10364/g.19626 Transcript_10364/m.19626 type:complete len:207 (+) Transcript_10364:41-661(+)
MLFFLFFAALFAQCGWSTEFISVLCKTSVGDIEITLRPDWSPSGAARFAELVDDNFFENMLLYRALDGFLIQTGVAAKPEMNAKWSGKVLEDEPKKFQVGEWQAGMLSYAGAGPNSRDHHFFFTLSEEGTHINPHLGGEFHEVPFAEIVVGLDNLKKVFFGYGDDPLDLQQTLQAEGNRVMLDKFPKLDRIHFCARQPPMEPEKEL